jgi:hypothetical protein
MDWIHVQSSNLEAVRYNPEMKILGVKFRNNTEYEYKNVPEQIFDGLLNADSHGSYLAKYIKGVYLYRKIK